jgi:hypothetical protein
VAETLRLDHRDQFVTAIVGIRDAPDAQDREGQECR